MTVISSAQAEVPAATITAADIAAAILLDAISLMALCPDGNMPDLRPACAAPIIAD
jgi:hypothetical protein